MSMVHIKKIHHFLFVFLLFSFLGELKAERTNYGGLLFQGYGFDKDQRTSLNLSPEDPFKFKKGFRLSFDISLLGKRDFGYIFKIIEDEKRCFHLAHVPDRANDRVLLKFVDNGKNTPIEITLQPQDLYRNRWHLLRFNFYYQSGLMECWLGDSLIGSIPHHLKPTSSLEFIFGVNPKGKFISTDLPHFVLRNVELANPKGEPAYFWPLTQTFGDQTLDVIEGRKAFVINPRWLAKKHGQWESWATCKASAMPGMAFDPVSKNLFVVNSRHLEVFNANSREKIKEIKSAKETRAPSKNIAIHDGNRLRSYNFQGYLYSVFNQEENTWRTLRIKNELGNYWHHNTLVHPTSGDLMVLAGYGGMHYFNGMFSLDTTDLEWKPVPLKNKGFYPRYLAALGKGFHSGEYFIFGGYGNREGKQELGMEYYYDLHLLDLKDSTIKKVWNLNLPDKHVVPIRDLWLSKKDSTLYTLVFDNHHYHSFLRLAKISLNPPSMELVGDSIPFLFRDTRSWANLFFNDDTHEFIAATRYEEGDSSRVRFYSLVFPPLDSRFLENQRKEKGSFNNLWVLAVLGVGGLLLFIFSKGKWFGQFFKKGSLNKGERDPAKEIYKDEEGIETASPKAQAIIQDLRESAGNRICFLGGFKIFDRQGEDISKLVSPKLRQLFLLILCKTLEEKVGITSREMNTILWPGQTAATAKNNRGVNMTRLRNVLKQLDGVEVIYKNNHWSISLGNTVYFDLLAFRKELKRFEQHSLDEEALERLLFILGRGTVLPISGYEWLDSFKDGVTSEITDFLTTLIQENETFENFDLGLKVCDVLLIHDPVNEEALIKKIQILESKGKHLMAKVAYDHFNHEYRKWYNEDFPLPFEKIL